MGQGIDTRQQTYCLLFIFEEMENLLIHNCIGSHTNCFIQILFILFLFIWIYCGKQRDGRINGLNVWTCMKDVCEYFASNTLFCLSMS